SQDSANLRVMIPPSNDENATVKQQAQAAGVSERTMTMARKVVSQSPDAAERVKSGSEKLHEAVAAIDKKVRAVEAPPSDRRCDEFGNELPDGIASVFTEVHRLSELKRQIETIRRDVAEMCETRDPLFAFLRLQQFEAEMKNAAACVRFAIPYCLCPKCGGDK